VFVLDFPQYEIKSARWLKYAGISLPVVDNAPCMRTLGWRLAEAGRRGPPWPSCVGPREGDLQEVRYGKQGSVRWARCLGDHRLLPAL